MVKMIETIKKSYIIELSTKSVVRCDPDELPKLMQAMEQGVPVILKQGLVNPSYIVAVREDEERIRKFLDDTKYPEDAQRRARGLEPLANIFAETPLLPPASHTPRLEPHEPYRLKGKTNV